MVSLVGRWSGVLSTEMEWCLRQGGGVVSLVGRWSGVLSREVEWCP